MVSARVTGGVTRDVDGVGFGCWKRRLRCPGGELCAGVPVGSAREHARLVLCVSTVVAPLGIARMRDVRLVDNGIVTGAGARVAPVAVRRCWC